MLNGGGGGEMRHVRGCRTVHLRKSGTISTDKMFQISFVGHNEVCMSYTDREVCMRLCLARVACYRLTKHGLISIGAINFLGLPGCVSNESREVFYRE
jgi:hypothetical protein